MSACNGSEPGWLSRKRVWRRVRGEEVGMVEINFLCVHKKLRAKRLAPVLIKVGALGGLLRNSSIGNRGNMPCLVAPGLLA